MKTIPLQLEKYIATRDKKQDGSVFTLIDTFKELVDKGVVEVGGRSTCGAGKVDPTWKFFTSWNEVVKKANSMGFDILIERVKHENRWATINGGFWHSNIYRIAANR